MLGTNLINNNTNVQNGPITSGAFGRGDGKPMADKSAPADRDDVAITEYDLGASRPVPIFAYLALLLLFFVNFFSYVDRQIIAILASSMQKDLGLSDAQLGFLLGTAFATLYGIFGIAMGRISDAVNRTHMIAAGLTFWSAMTTISGAAFNFATLAPARVGVGIGEAMATPCAYSLLSDYFPARNRSVVLAIYLIGIPLGGACAFVFGGVLLSHWPVMCRHLPGNACGIASWKASFVIVGLPGLILAPLIWLLPEPRRWRAAKSVPLIRIIVRELSAAVLPLTFINLYMAGGWPAVRRNAVIAVMLAAVGGGIGYATGDWLQWIALAVGGYSIAAWSSVLKLRDRPLYRLSFGSPTFLFAMTGAGVASILATSVGVWGAAYAMRALHAPPQAVGIDIGGSLIFSATVSNILGGVIADRWKRHDSRAPVWMILICTVIAIVPLLAMIHAHNLTSFTLAFLVFNFFTLAWTGLNGALMQDLVLPRMRGTAAGVYTLCIILMASGLGPYWVGKISEMTGSLATGLLCLIAFVPLAAILLLAAARRLRVETPESRLLAAEAEGEPRLV